MLKMLQSEKSKHYKMYLQTHHLDLEYYNDLFIPGAYLQTHADHLARRHGIEE